MSDRKRDVDDGAAEKTARPSAVGVTEPRPPLVSFNEEPLLPPRPPHRDYPSPNVPLGPLGTSGATGPGTPSPPSRPRQGEGVATSGAPVTAQLIDAEIGKIVDASFKVRTLGTDSQSDGDESVRDVALGTDPASIDIGYGAGIDIGYGPGFVPADGYEPPDYGSPRSQEKQVDSPRSQAHDQDQPRSATVPEPRAARVEAVNDTPTSEDALGFDDFTNAIAEFLLHPRTEPPLTLSIEGEWGLGKSSFMLQLQDALTSVARRRHAAAKPSEPLSSKETPGMRIVTFSAWRYEKDEAVWASFALEFLEQIAPGNRTAEFWRRARLTCRRFDWAEGWRDVAKVALLAVAWILLGYLLLRAVFFPTLVPDDTPESNIEKWWHYLRWFVPVALSQPIMQLWRKLAELPSLKSDLRKFVRTPSYRQKLPFASEFHEDFRRMLEVYVGPRDKVFIFIDDLDRCEVPKAAELLQALNVMIPENSRLIFILGIDRDKVAAGIAARYEALLPYVAGNDVTSKLAYGHSFLEKFVQLPFRLPRANKEQLSPLLDRLLKYEPPGTGAARRRAAQLGEPADNDSAEVRQAMEMVAPTLRFNPRRLKHFLNLFRLRYYVAEARGLFRGTSVHTPFNITHLAKLVAIELQWPAFLEASVRQESLLDPDDRNRPVEAVRWWQINELKELLEYGVPRRADYGDLQRAEDFLLAKEHVELFLVMGARFEG